MHSKLRANSSGTAIIVISLGYGIPLTIKRLYHFRTLRSRLNYIYSMITKLDDQRKEKAKQLWVMADIIADYKENAISDVRKRALEYTKAKIPKEVRTMFEDEDMPLDHPLYAKHSKDHEIDYNEIAHVHKEVKSLHFSYERAKGGLEMYLLEAIYFNSLIELFEGKHRSKKAALKLMSYGEAGQYINRMPNGALEQMKLTSNGILSLL